VFSNLVAALTALVVVSFAIIAASFSLRSSRASS